MTILGIDTAIPTASVAIIENDRSPIEEIQTRSAASRGYPTDRAIGTHAEVLLPLVHALFARAQVGVDDLSGLAISIGPGSFTGLRIGLATAKGMAYASNLPLAGVSTLHANAARVRDFEGVIGSMVDARKGEVYLALFRRRSETIARLTPDAAFSVEAAIDLVRAYQIGSNPVMLIGNGAEAYEHQVQESLGTSVRISSGDGYPSIATQAALLARSRLADGSGDDLGALAPVYLRAAEAGGQKKKLAYFSE
jgi:tRNA threonylcarbamoyladenosine biosynthesis protein TsaB